MRPPKDWKITIGPNQTSVLAEILNCHEVWRWLTKPQRTALTAADDSGQVTAHPVVVRRLAEHGLVNETGLLTDAGKLVLGWNDEDGGRWRERLKSLREEMSRGKA